MLIDNSWSRIITASTTGRDTQTLENHFLAGQATADGEFPLQLWCYLLFQAEMTLNMLCTSRRDHTTSAYEVLKRKSNCNATPLAPPGTNALIYKASPRQAVWAPQPIHTLYPQTH